MTSDALLWTYALAPDLDVEREHGGAFLRSATGRARIEDAAELDVLELLAGEGGSEAEILGRLRLSDAAGNSETRCAALLFRLDRLGFLTRRLSSRGRLLTSCVPLRPPLWGPPERPPERLLRLSPNALAHTERNMLFLEAPGGWARLAIHDRDLLPLLHDLAVGRPAAELAALSIAHSEEAILAVLALMSWCGLFDRADHEKWSGHDLLFHARTRRGYARVLLGKTGTGSQIPDQLAPDANADGRRRVVLEPPDLARLIGDDPPHALVSDRRRSIRRQGSVALTSGQLSEFLFRTLHERGGRRPYPSGGACYPLKAYIAVRDCRGVTPGLYAYDPALHELVIAAEHGPGLDRLFADAAGAADVERPPQILLVLAARYARTHEVYGDLSYSLILKEVGAVFQAAMMAAAAMGLGTCPLGCGDSLLFADLVGVNPLTETSVGEMMVGSLEALND